MKFEGQNDFLLPPERLPEVHVEGPAIRSDSIVTIMLKRGGCFGLCPIYDVAVSTAGIEFDGHAFVTALGKHTASIDGNEVRKLAKKFVAADFYSMDAEYIACVTDVSVYILSIEIDGHKKEVKDRRGRWVGMPSVISQLEDDVDTLAQTSRWIGTTLEGYLRELGRCLMSQAVEAKVKSMDASDDPFLAGKLIAYHEVLLIMLNRAGFFGIEPTSLGLEGFDPDEEL